MRSRRDPKSSITGMANGIDFTGHTERTHIQCDASLDSNFLESHQHSSPVQSEVTVVRSNSQSPRQSKKKKKNEIRSLLGTSGNASTLEDDSQVSKTRALTIHYFWGSRFFLSIYGIVLVSLMARRLVFLHGVSIVIIWRILDRVWVWGFFVLRSTEVKSILRHVRWISKFTFTQAGKAAEGDQLRGYIVTQTFKFWTGTGKNILKTLFRLQTSWIRQRTLKETRESLQQQILAKRKSVQESFLFQDNFRR